MNTGIQDSFNLSWKLAHVVKCLSPPCLLNTYEKGRLFRRSRDVGPHNEVTENISRWTDQWSWVQANRKPRPTWGQLSMEFYSCRPECWPWQDGRQAHSAYDVEVGGNRGTLRAGNRAPEAPESNSTLRNRATRQGSSNYEMVLSFARIARLWVVYIYCSLSIYFVVTKWETIISWLSRNSQVCFYCIFQSPKVWKQSIDVWKGRESNLAGSVPRQSRFIYKPKHKIIFLKEPNLSELTTSSNSDHPAAGENKTSEHP